MTAVIKDGHRNWHLQQTKEGERIYTITHVVTADVTDGPRTIMNTPGLPAIGSIWNFDSDIDVWAFCSPVMTVIPMVKNEKNTGWTVEQKFMTPRLLSERCQDDSIEDPLLEPMRISGSFTKYTQEENKDKDGNLILSSSHELFRGPLVEFDKNRPTVQIGQNKSALGLETFSEMIDTVNDSTLWGLGPRKVKLSNVSWERKLYGTCNFYYTRNFEFDINFDTFDRNIVDEGTKVLRGRYLSCETGTGTAATIWEVSAAASGDPDNPLSFQRFKDCHGENTRTLLDGAGAPLTDKTALVFVEFARYSESNFLLLGIPTTL